MEQLIEFLGNHPILCSTWFGLMAAIIWSEGARGGAQVSPAQATAMINREDAVVVDIRKKEEFRTGHLPEAINIPAANIESRIGELEPYKSKPVILVCKAGTSAGAAGASLRKAGFENVSRLKGGIMEWQSNKMPLVKS